MLSGARGAHPARTASVNQRPPTHYLADLHGKCFNCLSTAHRVATCKLPPCCLRCKGFRTSCGTVSSGGRCILPALAQLMPQKVGNDALSESVPWAIGRVPRAACRARLELCQVRLRTATVGGDVGDIDADKRGTTPLRQRVSPPTVTAGRQGPPKRHRTSPRSPLVLRHGTVGRPT